MQQTQSRFNASFFKNLCPDANKHLKDDYTNIKPELTPEQLTRPFNDPTALHVDYKKIEDNYKNGWYDYHRKEVATCNEQLYFPHNTQDSTAVNTPDSIADPELSNVKLSENITPESAIIINTKKTIDLGGYTIEKNQTATDNAITVEDGADLTIKNGTIESNNFGILANGGITTIENTTIRTIDIENDELNVGFGLYPISANAGSTVIINSGVFEGSTTAIQSNGGKIIINNGVFNSPTDKTISNYNEDDGNKFTLNIIDSFIKNNANVDVRDFIEVRGGKFINYNPAESYSEPAPHSPCSFVADGYTTGFYMDGNDTVYVVVKEVDNLPTELDGHEVIWLKDIE